MIFKFKKAVFISLCLLFAFGLIAAESANFVWSCDEDKVVLNVVENCYIYADGLVVAVVGKNGENLELIAPETTNYKDEVFGDVAVFAEGEHIWKASQKIGRVEINYQGCRKPSANQQGICFMPEELILGEVESEGGKQVTIVQEESEKLPIIKLLDNFRIVDIKEGTMDKAEFIEFLSAGENAQKTAENFLADKGVILMSILLFIGGFLLNFTPCVLPMIPINLAIIGANQDKKQGFKRGLIYGVGMMLAYGILGLTVVLGGAKFGTLNSSSVFNFVIAGIFVLLALAMLDVWHLDFSRYQSKINLDKWRNSQNILAFFMGITSALLAGACVAPAVIVMLLTSSWMYNNSEYFGLFLPFIFGAGMALPWPIAAFVTGFLPKPGKWMMSVKYVFAVFIFGMAIYYAVLGFRLLPSEFDSGREIAAFEFALIESRGNKKLVLVDFWATWCKNCTSMKRNVLQDPEIKELIDEDYQFVEFQAEKFDDENVREILAYFDIKGLPAFVILQYDE